MSKEMTRQSGVHTGRRPETGCTKIMDGSFWIQAFSFVFALSIKNKQFSGNPGDGHQIGTTVPVNQVK